MGPEITDGPVAKLIEFAEQSASFLRGEETQDNRSKNLGLRYFLDTRGEGDGAIFTYFADGNLIIYNRSGALALASAPARNTLRSRISALPGYEDAKGQSGSARIHFQDFCNLWPENPEHLETFKEAVLEFQKSFE